MFTPIRSRTLTAMLKAHESPARRPPPRWHLPAMSCARSSAI